MRDIHVKKIIARKVLHYHNYLLPDEKNVGTKGNKRELELARTFLYALHCRLFIQNINICEKNSYYICNHYIVIIIIIIEISIKTNHLRLLKHTHTTHTGTITPFHVCRAQNI